MAPVVVVGVDPGGRQTGVVVRCGADYLGGELVTRVGPEVFPPAVYLVEVVEAIIAAHRVVIGAAPLVAVEGVVHPSGHVRMINAAGLLGTAAVLGAVLGEFPDAVVVPPAGHGSGPKSAYPAEMWGAGERRGTGKWRHVRSAWDIADAGRFLARLAGVEG